MAALGLLVGLGAAAPPASAQTITEFSVGITAGAQPQGIASGPDGNLWFTEQAGDRIGRITPAGAITEFSAGIMVGASPYGIVSGPDGNLWFSEETGDRMGRITSAGGVTEFGAGISPGAQPTGVAAGPDGNIWFAEVGDGIGRITPAGVVTEFTAGITAGSIPVDIVAGPDGNLWFTELIGNRIGRITTAGVITEFAAGITPGAQPGRIAVGPDGNLWFTESGGDRIGRITTAGVVTEFSAGITPGAGPAGISSGPDGNLWFTESGGDRIGRITTAGVVTEFSAGITPGAGPQDITEGPDGSLWFTELNGDRIGRLALDPAPPVRGETANVFPVSGTVLVKLPGGDFVPLTVARSVPVGTIVDTRAGVVELTTAADGAGKTQTAQFKYGLFKITQSAKKGAYTELALTGRLAGCKQGAKRKGGKSLAAGASGPVAETAGARGRRLWGNGSGRFRTNGSRGSGAARGTIWQVTDRCDSTTEIRSIRGEVTARDFVRKRTEVLKSGQRYVAPGPRSRKR